MPMILDGKKIAQSIKEEINSRVERLKQVGITPKLSVVLVGSDPASLLYAQAKERACNKNGIGYELFHLAPDTPQEVVLTLIQRLNQDSSVHGIMVELPLPAGLDKTAVLRAVEPLKDVDGVHPVNRGLLLSGGAGLFPVTPQSCIEIILRSGLDIAGKHVVLVGRGETVGKPLIFMMLNQNATVTVCHTKTADLKSHTKKADILIVAIGQPGAITRDMVKPGAIVVDAGINETATGICGDVDFEQVAPLAKAITPVPGGVGSLTTTLLQRNLLEAIELSGSSRHCGLDPQSPTLGHNV